MSKPKGKRRAGLVGAAVGITAAVGMAAGFAAERYMVRRSKRVDDPYAGEPFGNLPYSAQRTLVSEDGIELYVEIVEADQPGDDVTLVMVHGFCLDMGTFHFQRRALQGQYRMVLYDQPGHGRSGRLTQGEYTLESLAAALAEVIAECAPTGRIVLFGHSMGGMSIMALAEQAPDLFEQRVAGVVLISTSAGKLDEVNFGLPDVVARFRRPLMPVLGSAGPITTAVVDRARRASTDLAWLLTRRYGFGTPRPSPALVSYVERMNSTTSMEVIARYLRTLYAHSRLLLLGPLRDVPVLIICGDSDALTPLDHTYEIAAVLPDAEVIVVAEGGHVVLLEHADLVNDAIDRYLRKVLTQ